MPQLCPWCGSDKVVTETQPERFAVPHGPSVEIQAVTDTCAQCGESGDFGGVNDSAITRARENSIKASVPLMLEQLARSNCTMAYIERSLSLPTRTLARWKIEGTSAAAVALLRMITTFPWLLDVADNGYQPDLARGILVREAGNALVARLKDHGVGCIVATSSARNAATVNLTFSMRPEGARSLESAIEVRQLPSGASNARS